MKDEPAIRFDHLPRTGKRFKTRVRLARGFLDTGPLVDVALLLMMFVIFNSDFIVQPGVTVQLPESPLREGNTYGSMVLRMTQENLIFFNDERTTMEGLLSHLRRAHSMNKDAVLIVEADGRVPHRLIVEIYNKALQAGIPEVSLATRVSSAAEPEPEPEEEP
ncbi:MAG: biopolymer transporter ExbD [Verrucomicrobiota bacterium]